MVVRMTFGEKLKELRLNKAHMGLRKFATEAEIRASDLSDIERGRVQPPQFYTWINKIRIALNLKEDSKEYLELHEAWLEQFVMKKMENKCFPLFACTSDGKPAKPEKLIKFAEHMKEIAEEHNRKADEYNDRQREDS